LLAYEKYAKDVLSGKQIAGSLIRDAVHRYYTLKENPAYLFDPAAVDHVLKFIQVLRHTSGDFGGQNFILLPWQQFLIANIFGFKVKETGKRLITKVYVEVARKNGKSELAGAIALYLTFFDNEKGAQVYSAANAYDQASICWSAAAIMASNLIKESTEFNKLARVYNSTNNRTINHLEHFGTYFRPLAVTKTLDGLRPHGTIVDEYHEAPDDSVLRVMESGMGNRSQPLLFIITTAGFNVNGPCYQYRKTVVDILEGRKENDNTFGLIYTIDENDKWEDEKVWAKANPSMPATPTIRGMRDAYQKAVTEGATAEINFRTKNLNQWLTTRSRWVSDAVFMRGNMPVLVEPGLNWWCGIDLALTTDITAIVFVSSKDSRGKHNILPFFFVPEENAKERARRDGVPYLDWIKQGFISTTPGEQTDYDYIEAFVIQQMNELKASQIFYDRYKATQMTIEFKNAGFECIPFAQQPVYFNAPLSYLEKGFAGGIFAHGGNPVLRWMMQNVSIYADGNGNIKVNKGGSNERVDGVVALGMATAGILNSNIQDSVYNTEDRGFLML
jgi:phage terminase large subunit-like protein